MRPAEHHCKPLQLPDGEGLDMVQQLRREGRRTPALVLSAIGGRHGLAIAFAPTGISVALPPCEA